MATSAARALDGDVDERPGHQMSGDVIVVGAGLAGLAAAVRLHEAGRDVLVMESSDAVGGRIRTDVVDGFRLDRGFQVHNTAYPEAARLLDQPALGLRPFTRGALIHYDGRRHRVVDPRRQPATILTTARSPVLPLGDKARIAALAAWCAYAPVDRLVGRSDTSTADALRNAGIGPEGIERFLRPFLSGVLQDRELSTSARFFRLVWRTFVRGDVVVPAGGMQAIPEQLAARLPDGAIRLHRAVAEITEAGIRTVDGESVAAGAVVVATDAADAHGLLPGLRPPSWHIPAWHGVTTFYHALAEAPLDEPILLLDADQPDLIANTVVMTTAAPSYSSDGRALLSTSVVGPRRDDPALAAAVRHRLAVLYGIAQSELEPVASYRVDRGVPAMPPPLQLRKPVRLAPGRYVAGDWRDTSSIQGALVSGRRAADALMRDDRR